jgi:RsiW-degrading membrane proteinase PrsW (M82 family)
MQLLIIIHFIINITILIPYLLSKEQKPENLWKEIIMTILFGWIVVFLMND